MAEQKQERYVRRHTPAYAMCFQDSGGLWHFEYENGHTGDILGKNFHKLFALAPEPSDPTPGAMATAGLLGVCIELRGIIGCMHDDMASLSIERIVSAKERADNAIAHAQRTDGGEAGE